MTTTSKQCTDWLLSILQEESADFKDRFLKSWGRNGLLNTLDEKELLSRLVQAEVQVFDAFISEGFSKFALLGLARMVQLGEGRDERDGLQGSTTRELVGGGFEGLRAQAYVTKREQLVADLWDRAKRHGYILIKAPPQSGKTSLLQLLQKHAQGKGVRAYYMTLAEPRHPDEIILRVSGKSLPDWAASQENVLFLIDEAQKAYKTACQMWSYAKMLGSGDEDCGGVRLVFAAPYGLDCRPGSSSASTPVAPAKHMVVSMQPREGCACLTLTQEEYCELWTSFVYTCGVSFTTEAAESVVKDAIFEATGAQVGLVVYTLDFIMQKAGPSGKQQLDKAAQYCLKSENFFLSLHNVRSIVHYPSIMEHVPGADELLNKLLYDGFTSDQTAAAVSKLHRTGVLLHDVMHEGRFVFTSPLHEKYYMMEHFKRRPRRVASLDNMLVDLVQKAVQCMSSDTLSKSVGRGTDGRLLERAWQMEFYRAITLNLPSDIVCSPDVGTVFGSFGYIDFFISDRDWAIELLRDASDVLGHLGRFRPGGRYFPLVERKDIKDYVVVDLRCSQSAGAAVHTDQHLITVTLNEEFNKAIFKHSKSDACQLTIGG